MSLLGLSNAASADKVAAELQFFGRIKDYALADAKGLATKEVSASLRSKRWHKDWSTALGNLRAQNKDKGLTQILMDRALEASQLKRKFAIEAQGDTESITAKILHDFDLDYTGRTLGEIQILLLAEILMELRSFPSQAGGE